MFNRRNAWSGLAPSPHADYLPRYQQLRTVGMELNQRLVESLPKSTINEGGKKLGMLKKNVLVFNQEDDIAILMDCCLHDFRWKGKTAVEHFLADTPPPDGSDDMLLLQALLQARYTLFAVESAARGVGVHVEDLLLGERLFIMDVGFSQSARKGLVLAARLFAPEGVYRSTGAALPAGLLEEANRAELVQGLRALIPGGDYRQATPEQRSEFALKMVRSLLERGASDHVAYSEPGEFGIPGPGLAAPGRTLLPSAGGRSTGKVGRNERCPCGSGKKFKQCCLNRS